MDIQVDALNAEQTKLVRHAVKAVCLARRQILDFEEYKHYEDTIFDELFKEVGIPNGRKLVTVDSVG